MSAQPVEQYEDPRDPQVILRDLPERERPAFHKAYRQAMRAAADDPAKYRELTRLLRAWRARVVAVNTPGFYETVEEARRGEMESIPLEDAFAALKRP